MSRQINQYDKILRENMEAALPGLIKDLLGIDAVHMEELPDDLQQTKERKPDVLKRITDKNGETFLLHVELQTTDEKEMVLRMAEYFIMLLRRYRLPARQYVIYLGMGVPNMADHVQVERLHFSYQLIVLSAVDYHLLLSASNPEEKIYAILADFRGNDPRLVVNTIVKEVISSSKGELAQLKHIEQLRMLSNLRKLGPEIDITMESIAKWFKIENDPFYQKGQKEGIERGLEKGIERGMEKKTLEVVKTLLLNTRHSVREIANLVNVSETFVRKVKRSLRA